tara:strand:+ start:4917 stop:7769 length:2853 start_codon:yes stop_codon:yes gene_type:complete
MLLKDYISHTPKKLSNISFSGIAFNSLKVKKNYVFFAIKGKKFDGNSFIENAIKNGAKVIVSEKKNLKKKSRVTFLYSSNVRKLLAEVSYKIFYRKMKKFVAVTGTNGKSSIADFYFQILKLNSKRVASIGTLGLKYKNITKNLTNTTSDPIQIGSMLKVLKKKKIEFAIMEASSHGLDQNRLDGLRFDIGIFTNLSHDHLDYHKNMKNYFNSKLYLFKHLIKKRGNIITDDKIPEAQKIKKISIKRNINLSLIYNEFNGIQLISHRFEKEKQILEIKFKKFKYKIHLNLIGKIQVKNILMAIIAAYKSGVEFKKILKVLPRIKSVEGRLEKIGKIHNNSKVILDYAHTPAALELALSNLKEQFPSNKINLIFGCGGDRDLNKRPIMGKIAEKYSNEIYLTDDNPRNENPFKIRNEIKKGIKNKKIYEIPDRKKAIQEAVKNLKTGDILLVAGKGHEKIQDYGVIKTFFSDKKVILETIKSKNKFLSKNLKLNIIQEQSKSNLSNKLSIKDISINSKSIKKNDVFFAIKGKKVDGNNYVSEALKKKSSFAVVNRLNKNHSSLKQIKVKNTLEFLTECSSILRENINAKIISITGSCGKTTLKEMIGTTLKKISKTSFSPKSFNNKYGVPLSLFNMKQNDDFGVFEIGMDKKGEINNLSKIIKPDLGIITNISYAHSKNFKSIKNIADAKAEIMNNIKKDGIIVLNADDHFYYYLKKLAFKKKLKTISFGIKNKFSEIKLVDLKKIKDKFELLINANNVRVSFYTKNNNKNNLYNILATIASLDAFINIVDLKKDIFLKINTPEGRGDIFNINFKNKKIYFVDESYNSNPLSLKNSIENFEKIESKKSKKYIFLGDMLELGKHSIKQHKLISKIINKAKINKVYVIGKHIRETYKGLKPDKKAKILSNKFDMLKIIKNDFKDGDYLMVKGSNSTGLNKFIIDLKQRGRDVV